MPITKKVAGSGTGVEENFVTRKFALFPEVPVELAVHRPANSVPHPFAVSVAATASSAGWLVAPDWALNRISRHKSPPV